MKRYISIVIIAVFLLLLLCGCRASSYKFIHSMEMIEKIELLQNPTFFTSSTSVDNLVSIRELTSEEILSFMTSVYAMKTRKGGFPPTTGYGWYIAKVTYTNGDVEMIGDFQIALVKAGELPTGYSTYIFSDHSIRRLFLEYVDVERFPPPAWYDVN